MPSHPIFIHHLAVHGGAAAQRWLEDSTELALAFSHDVQGEHPASNASDVHAICLAAAILWRTSDGQPCWSELDADELLAELERLELQPNARDSVLIAVYTFYCFLAKHGHLPREAAARAQDRLVPWVRPVLEGLLADMAGALRHIDAAPASQPN